MSDTDARMRELMSQQPVPEFPDPAFVQPKPLAESRVAIVTTAALHTEGDPGWQPGSDPRYTVLDAKERAVQMGHFSPNFDRGGFAADLNVVYPADRLEELAARGTIGSVASHHYAFAGNQPEGLSELRLDTGPACAEALKADGVDVVLLTPV